MIVDTSAIIAIVLGEPGFEGLVESLEAAPVRRMSVATRVELSVVADRRLTDGERRTFERVMDLLDITLMPVSIELGELAQQAHRRFGVGSGSPAKLNFGDCFSYALAKSLDQPLLFVGDDFSHTDVDAAKLP